MIKKINPDIDLLFMPFPAYHENQAKVVVKIDATLGVSASCKHLEAVEQFLDYVFQRMSVNIMQTKRGHIPV